ncbi:DEAD-box ATP-dependent RNA helicase 17 [Apostasia shenzhenica]|uniref:DEAD-box ATP-dependent RNA helicase 17 n=1 Tax=Apostasia shenzhenica TaxID=1088818 RepID=A0A2I0AZT9_9ASPA|nr:DEAD-box ATP-dependent RNA helicase 17 [Apostasia shenzhenica]
MERRIEIRTIGGESTTVLISPDRWVRDLKALLRESFSTAIKSTNFHLFLKGAKLDLNSRIDSQQIKEGEFIVLVPFVKKSQKLSSQQYPVDQSFRPSMPPGENLASQTADSTWLDTMNDISSIAHTLHRSGISGMEKVEEPHDECPAKRKKLSGNYDAIHDLLSSGSKDVFDHQICGKICELVESIKCFSNPITGTCLLLEHFAEKSLNTEQCACPLWLKRVLKAFTLLNVLYAFFYRQNKSVTWNLLEQVLKQSGIFGLDDLSTSFVEKLSLVSPKVIIILGNGQKVATPLGLAIIIGDMSTNASDQPEFKKEKRNARQKSIFVITKAVEKRMETFRTDLWKLIRCFMENQLSKAVLPCMPSLEDIINMRDHVTIPECSNIKKAKSGAAVQRCCGTNLLEPTEMVDHLQKGLGISGQIVHIEEINPKLATHVDIPDSLADVLKEALLQIGITRLYDHQAEALQSSLSGKHVVIATSTSSGKSLCYNMRVVEALSTDMTACALYMFPTKALAQDQKRAFVEMTSGFDFGLNVSIYDGDTSQKHRKWIENNARVLITNPDMLHLSILPYHTKFQRIFANLRIIVVDEAHIYKGAFGCHTSLILRRLKRICLHVYGCDPLFIFCTATLANPREHTMELGNLQNVELIQNDGSPCGAKHFVLWNPPFRTEATRSERKTWNGEFSNRRIRGTATGV